MLCYRYAEFILHLSSHQSHMLSLCGFHHVMSSIDRLSHSMSRYTKRGLITAYPLYQSDTIGANRMVPASLKSVGQFTDERRSQALPLGSRRRYCSGN